MAKKKTKKSTVSKGANIQPGRDRLGRFTKGAPAGPGNPHVKILAEYRAAIAEAIEPEDLKRVMETLFVLAVGEKSVHAAQVLLDRCCGKPQAAQDDAGCAIELPTMDSIEALPGAVQSVMQAASDGSISMAQALSMNTLIDNARRCFELVELEKRICALEQEKGIHS